MSFLSCFDLPLVYFEYIVIFFLLEQDKNTKAKLQLVKPTRGGVVNLAPYCLGIDLIAL